MWSDLVCCHYKTHICLSFNYCRSVTMISRLFNKTEKTRAKQRKEQKDGIYFPSRCCISLVFPDDCPNAQCSICTFNAFGFATIGFFLLLLQKGVKSRHQTLPVCYSLPWNHFCSNSEPHLFISLTLCRGYSISTVVNKSLIITKWKKKNLSVFSSIN